MHAASQTCMLQTNECAEQRKKLFCVAFVSYRRKTENTEGKFPDEICQIVGTLSKELADMPSLWPCFPALGKLILL